MYCRNCGSEVLSGSKYCGKCGFQTLEWERQKAQNVYPQPVQSVQPVQQPKKSYGWIIFLVLFLIFFIFVLPFLVLFGLAFYLTTITSSYDYDYDYDSFNYSTYVYVNNDYVPTLYHLGHESSVCDSEGYNYSNRIKLEYCDGEVTRDQIDEYEDYLMEYYEYTPDNGEDHLYKEVDNGKISIDIKYGDETVIVYSFVEKDKNSL